VLYPYRTVEQ